MIAFIVLIVAMGIKMATSSQSLYEVDYYEKGEEHTSRMNLEKEGEHVDVEFLHRSNKLKFNFDSLGYIQTIKLLNLSNSNLDRTLEINSNDVVDQKEEVTVSLGDLSLGIWVLEISGFVNDKSFFIKKQIIK
ncbi:MAG: hypothetical protein KJP21_02055 [Bacteroidia bacterium]|nr:hypothetical protein [Bacteroidia bacterium]NNJ55923.1 hypothetical protein [Bacteroidia bacterium]